MPGFDFVNGELCCVVVGDGLTRDTAPAFYDALWGSLNESAGGLVKEWLGYEFDSSSPSNEKVVVITRYEDRSAS